MTEKVSKLRREIELLTVFFSAPNKVFFELLYKGHSTLGDMETEASMADFSEALEIEMTELFVNSPLRRPLYPVASEYAVDESSYTDLREELAILYGQAGKQVTQLPQDHIQVLLEFLTYLLDKDDLESAQEFCQKYIESWTSDFVTAILEREPSAVVIKAANMLKNVCTSIKKMN